MAAKIEADSPPYYSSLAHLLTLAQETATSSDHYNGASLA